MRSMFFFLPVCYYCSSNRFLGRQTHQYPSINPFFPKKKCVHLKCNKVLCAPREREIYRICINIASARLWVSAFDAIETLSFLVAWKEERSRDRYASERTIKRGGWKGDRKCVEGSSEQTIRLLHKIMPGQEGSEMK